MKDIHTFVQLLFCFCIALQIRRYVSSLVQESILSILPFYLFFGLNARLFLFFLLYVTIRIIRKDQVWIDSRAQDYLIFGTMLILYLPLDALLFVPLLTFVYLGIKNKKWIKSIERRFIK